MKHQIRHRFAEALTPWGRRSFYSDVLAQSSRLIVLNGGSPQSVSDVLERLIIDAPHDQFEVYHSIWSPFAIISVLSLTHRVTIFPRPIIEQDIMGSLPARVSSLDLPSSLIAWPRASHRTSRLLAMAKFARDEMEDLIKPYVREGYVASVRHQLIDLIPPSTPVQGGQIRHFFGGSLTSNGWVNFLREAFDDVDRRIYFHGTFGLDHTNLIRWFGERAAFAGYDVDFYHCEWDSSHVDHVIIPALKTGITLATAPHALELGPADLAFDMSRWISAGHPNLLPLIKIYQTSIHYALTSLFTDAPPNVDLKSDPKLVAQNVRAIQKILDASLILS